MRVLHYIVQSGMGVARLKNHASCGLLQATNVVFLFCDRVSIFTVLPLLMSYCAFQTAGGGFSDLQTDTKGTSSASFSLEANLGSCKSMCLGVSSCVALSFSGTTCKFYAIKPSIGSRSGSTYYEKSCPQGIVILVFSLNCLYGLNLQETATAFLTCTNTSVTYSVARAKFLHNDPTIQQAG